MGVKKVDVPYVVFYVNQSKNVGKVGKIMFDFMGKCRYNDTCGR